VNALNKFLAENEGKKLTVADLEGLGHLDQYHYRGVQACDEVVTLLNLQEGERLLDVGAGVGGPARSISARTKCSVTAVEVLEDLSQMARVLNERVGLDEKIEWIHGDMCTAEVEPASCDAMMSLLVILHIKDRATLFSKIATALKPGATFLIEDMVCVAPGGVMPERPAELLRTLVHAPFIPTQQQYEEHLREAGFTDIVFENLSASWRSWAMERSRQFESTLKEQIAKMGADAAEDRRKFYAAVAECFASGALGGVRITGRKVGGLESRLVAGRQACARSIHPVGNARILELETDRRDAASAEEMRLAAAAASARPTMPPFPQPAHDHLQFHFFAGDKFVQARVFKTETLCRAWAWCYVDGVKRVLFETDVPATSTEREAKRPRTTLNGDSSDGSISLKSGDLTMRVVDGSKGSIVITRDDGTEVLSVATETVTDKRWQVPGQPDMVIHRPDLSAKVKLDGQQFDAVGYSKRYFGDYPEHWGYRFIHGTFPGMGHKFLWTADATFGDSKYNYFKLVDGPDFYESPKETVYHQQQCAWGSTPFGQAHVKLEPIVEKETLLKSGAMNSRMREIYGKLTVTVKSNGLEEVWTGVGMNEINFGTLL
jgi:cyclopropane fatty-acyl-phospholipid synthase-like methyltransferase